MLGTLSEAVVYVEKDCWMDNRVDLVRWANTEYSSKCYPRTDNPPFWFSLGRIRKSNRDGRQQSPSAHRQPGPGPRPRRMDGRRTDPTESETDHHLFRDREDLG